MAFIRRKRTSAGHVYQVVRSVRDGQHVRQIVLCSLGAWATVGAALQRERRQLVATERLPGRSSWVEAQLTQHRARIAELERVQRETGVA
jgi:hypothetical protein